MVEIFFGDFRSGSTISPGSLGVSTKNFWEKHIKSMFSCVAIRIEYILAMYAVVDEMLAAVVMCTHFRSYLRGSQFTLRTDHSSLWWLQKLRNEDGMLARWYLLLGQFSVTFEYRPGSQHLNADGMSRQCGQCKSKLIHSRY